MQLKSISSWTWSKSYKGGLALSLLLACGGQPAGGAGPVAGAEPHEGPPAAITQPPESGGQPGSAESGARARSRLRDAIGVDRVVPREQAPGEEPPSQEPPFAIECLGDQLTRGMGLDSATTQAWPAVLAQLLGASFEVPTGYAAPASGLAAAIVSSILASNAAKKKNRELGLQG
jgi:hypothetical protein